MTVSARSPQPRRSGKAATRNRPKAARRGAPRPRRPPQYVVRVADQQSQLEISTDKLRRVAKVALSAEGMRSATISIALVDNAAIHRLNRRHLNHDYPTDVLSFLFESDDPPAPANGDSASHIDGEVIISAEMAAQSAERYGWSARDELTLYLVHGLLHLCGYDDRTERKRAAMRRREEAILRLLRIDLPPNHSPPGDTQ
jgi:probable rRNA maturation factor